MLAVTARGQPRTPPPSGCPQIAWTPCRRRRFCPSQLGVGGCRAERLPSRHGSGCCWLADHVSGGSGVATSAPRTTDLSEQEGAPYLRPGTRRDAPQWSEVAHGAACSTPGIKTPILLAPRTSVFVMLTPGASARVSKYDGVCGRDSLLLSGFRRQQGL